MLTYGPKPKTLRMEEGGEEYFIGVEVGNFFSWNTLLPDDSGSNLLKS